MNLESLANIKPLRIAVLRLSAIGDVVLMVPAVRALQRAFPEAKITWIIGCAAHSLLEGLSGIDFIVVDKPKSWASFYRCYQQLKECSFDVLLAAQASLSANLIYPLIKASIKIGFDNARARDGHRFFVDHQIESRQEHLLDAFMQFAEVLGVAKTKPSWDLSIDDEAACWAQKILMKKTLSNKRWLAINPAASKSERNWLPKRYAEIIDIAVARWGVNVVLTGGATEKDVAMSQAVISLTTVNCLDLTGKTTLKQLASLLGEVDILLSPDTGPVHMAVAMGTPVVGLYAVVSARLSGPYLAQHLVVDKYDQAVREILQQDPASIAWAKHRVHDARAMELIQVEDVVAQLEKIFQEK